MCPNHSILSDPFYCTCQFTFSSSSSTHLFIPNSISVLHSHQISHTSSQVHLLSFSQYYSYPMPLLHTTLLVQIVLHIESSTHLSPVLHCSAHFSVLRKVCSLRFYLIYIKQPQHNIVSIQDYDL